MSKPTPPDRSALRWRILLTVLILLVVAASTIYGLVRLSQDDEQDDDAAGAPPVTAPAEPEPVCRAEGEFVAGFM